MTDNRALREKLEAMVEAWRVKHEDAALETSEIYRDAYHAIALDLLRRLEERETLGTADALKCCVWMPTAGGKWSPGCSPEAWEPLDTKAKFCPGCGHPVQVKQPQDAAEKGDAHA